MDLEKLSLPLETIDKGFKAGIGAAIAGTTALIGAMGVAIKATFDWANQMDSLQDVTGASNEAAAAWNFTLRKSGVATETLAKSMTILNKGLVDAKGKLDTSGKALKEWGINVFDANGKLKDQETLLADVANRYGELGTQQEKVNFLTEVFGKSGADLIDFFDTLAADGGINAVTQRVRELGLAIDPNRYEQFSRNLEEIKLMGLALAVGFTERVMPMLESLSSWITGVGIPAFKRFKDGLLAAFSSGGVGEALAFIDDLIGNVVQSMADSVNAWAAGSGPQELSDAIVSWIANIGTGGAIESQALTAAGNLVRALGNAFMSIDWSAIDAALDVWDARILETFDEWDASILATFDSWDAEILATFDRWDAGINEIVKNALTKVDIAFANWSVSSGTKVKVALQGLDASFATWSVTTGARFTTWASGVISTVVAWGGRMLSEIGRAMETLKNNMGAKVSAITEIFTSRFGSIPRKAAEAFNAGREELIGVVRTIVQEINKILSKIITSFKLTFGGVNWGNSTGVSNSTSFNGTANSSGSPDDRKSAAAAGAQAVSIANWFDFDYARLATEIVKAGNNV